jgi:hypothetical protein
MNCVRQRRHRPALQRQKTDQQVKDKTPHACMINPQAVTASASRPIDPGLCTPTSKRR